MLYPIELSIHNVGPYKGSHSLDLVDDVYAVTAKHMNNPERSNWLGKSTLLWCIPYALFGEHTAKTDNDWITNGESWSGVKLVLSDGSVINRIKTRDKPTQLSFKPNGGAELLQGAAQDAIAKFIGLSKDEFMTVCFYAQKELSRLVSARSAERIELVESWIAAELDPVQRMHARAMAELQKLMTGIETLKSEQISLRSSAEACNTAHGWDAGVDTKASLEKLVRTAEGELRISTAALEARRRVRLAAESWAAKVEIAAEFDAIAEEGQRLRKLMDEIPDDIDEQLRLVREDELAAVVAVERTRADVKQARAAIGGQFDGQCPVNCKACPKPKWVKDNPLDMAIAAQRSEADVAAGLLLLDVQAQRSSLTLDARLRTELDSKLQVLREQANALVDTANEVAGAAQAPDIATLDDDVDTAEELVTNWTKQLADAKAELALFVKVVARYQQTLLDEGVLLKRRVLVSDALQLLGKTGVQQRLGEIALANVEVGANAMLASTGIPLAVSVLWATQNQGLAKHCDKCGTAYGTSAKIKTCTRCGAQRGPNTAAKLVIDLTNRSGAAEDLAGIAVGLSASAWLRAKRGSNWGSVCIDEPFGALDQHNKKALSVHVATLLKNSFASAFIVAHDREILDALPQRVSIVGTDAGSCFEAP